MDGKSLDINAEKLAQLRTIFPEIFSEEKIDLQRLKTALGEETFVHGEHYELSWAGKSEARKEVQKQTTATLIPDKESSIDFENAQNVFIEGENLEVLRVLQKSYFGKIKMIYIDPPYNTGNDSFVYPDDYSERKLEYEKRTGLKDAEGFLNKQDLWRKNSKENGQFHSVWLSMMYPRLYLSRNLLREDGVIFISIDDNEVNNLKLLCDEIFGEENFVANLVWKRKATAPNDKIIGKNHEYILCYSKDINSLELFLLPRTEQSNKNYKNPDSDPRGLWTTSDLSANGKGGRIVQSCIFPILNPHNGQEYYPPENKCWIYNEEKVNSLIQIGQIQFRKNSGTPFLKRYLSEVRDGVTLPTILENAGFSQDSAKEIKEIFDKDVFEFPKPTSLIKTLLRIGVQSNENNFVLDFFAGSSTTAQAVMELNEEDYGDRKFICVQLPETTDKKSEAYKAGYTTIADITKARIRKVCERITKRIASKIAHNEQKIANLNKDIAQTLLAEEKARFQQEIDEISMENDSLENSLPSFSVKCYTLTPSNFKNWRSDVEGKEAIAEQLRIFQQSEKEGSESEKMFTELCLKTGLGVNVFYRLENEIYKTAKEIWFYFGKYRKELKISILEEKPKKVVLLNSAFESDMDLTNFQLELKENKIDLTII